MNRPAATYLGTFPSGSPEWHALRASGLGGSEIAAVLGLNPWESRFSLWHRKRGDVEQQADNTQMRWGRYLEDPVAQWFVDRHPELRVRRTGTWRSKARHWQIANPDRVATGPDGREVVEIKSARNGDGWGEPGTDEIPVYYRCQVLQYLDVLGLHRARVVVSIAGGEPVEYVVPWSLDEVGTLRTAGAEFMRTLATGERPVIDEHSATYQVVRELHPEIDDVEVEIDRATAWHYRQAIEVHTAAEAEKQYATSSIADAMGNARKATCDGTTIATRTSRKGGTPYVKAAPVKKNTQKVEATA